jgi:hypothetical protein
MRSYLCKKCRQRYQIAMQRWSDGENIISGGWPPQLDAKLLIGGDHI